MKGALRALYGCGHPKRDGHFFFIQHRCEPEVERSLFKLLTDILNFRNRAFLAIQDRDHNYARNLPDSG